MLTLINFGPNCILLGFNIQPISGAGQPEAQTERPTYCTQGSMYSTYLARSACVVWLCSHKTLCIIKDRPVYSPQQGTVLLVMAWYSMLSFAYQSGLVPAMMHGDAAVILPNCEVEFLSVRMLCPCTLPFHMLLPNTPCYDALWHTLHIYFFSVTLVVPTTPSLPWCTLILRTCQCTHAHRCAILCCLSLIQFL
jgi:hypothetical protein